MAYAIRTFEILNWADFAECMRGAGDRWLRYCSIRLGNVHAVLGLGKLVLC
jgi:hypothetical protein